MTVKSPTQERDNLERRYLYCYSPSLYKFLRCEKGIEYICTGKHIETDKQFWQFERTEIIEFAMNEYREKKLKIFNS
jgi:hypothetical protein